jgi:hypothetical protein
MDFEILKEHWSFIAVALGLAVLGEVIKRLVIPKGNPPVLPGWRGVYRVTMPLHPMLAGTLIGCIPGMPVPTYIHTLTGSALYFMAAGMSSGWAFAAGKHIAKERAGIELTI